MSPYLLILIPFIFPNHSITAKNSPKLDKIIDQLESKLLDDELRKNQNKKKPQSTVTEENIPTLNPHGKADFDSLSDKIMKLTNEVDNLSNEVTMIAEKLIKDKKIDNYIEIYADLNSEQHQIRKIEVLMDNYLIYHIDRIDQLWIPEKRLPLFLGPVQPGNHSIIFRATVANINRVKGKLIYTDNIIENVFPITVPTGKIRKKWNINIFTDKNSSSSIKTRIDEQKML